MRISDGPSAKLKGHISTISPVDHFAKKITRPRGRGWSRQLLDLIKAELKWETNPMQANDWVVTARLQKEDRKAGLAISPDGESEVVIFPVKNLSKVSRSCPCEKTETDLETAAYAGKAGWYKTASRSGEKRPGLSPVPRRAPGIGADRIGKFQGNIRGGRPLKGGGSVSGKMWNNDGRPLDVRTPRQGSAAALFQGNIKAKRPEKGGGSVSGKLWNNKENPIPGKTYSPDSKKVGRYPGRNKMFDLHPGFADQGETFYGIHQIKKIQKELCATSRCCRRVHQEKTSEQKSL